MNVNYFIILESRQNAQGERRITFDIRIAKRRYRISSGIKVKPKYWDDRRKRIKSSDPQSAIKNKQLSLLVSRLEELKVQILIAKRVLTREEIKDFLFGKQLTRRTKLKDYVLKKLESKNLSQSSKRKYRSVLQKFEDFKPNLLLEDITTDVLNQFLVYQREKLNNKPNTYYKALAIIKGFLTWAVEDGILDDNPAKKIKIKRFEGNREFLTPDEVKLLITLYHSEELSKPKREILQYFLFSCFTGLRYSDIKELKGKHIKSSIWQGKEILFLVKHQHKTSELVQIKLNELAKEFLPEKYFAQLPVFRVRTGQVTNRRLKEIMKMAGINKNITFHSARHTFASLSKIAGIEDMIIMKMVGHTDLKTTMNYIHITEDILSNEMDKINELFIDEKKV